MSRAELLASRLRDGVRSGSPAVDRLLDLLARLGDDAFDGDTFAPGHVTASGIVTFDDSVLLIRHSSLGRWMQPGGHVEVGDVDTEATARREVAEETGLAALETLGLVDVDVHEIPAVGDRPAHLHFDVRWAFRAGTDRVEASSEVAAVAWVPQVWAASIDESLARPIRALGGASLARPTSEVNP